MQEHSTVLPLPCSKDIIITINFIRSRRKEVWIPRYYKMITCYEIITKTII